MYIVIACILSPHVYMVIYMYIWYMHHILVYVHMYTTVSDLIYRFTSHFSRRTRTELGLHLALHHYRWCRCASHNQTTSTNHEATTLTSPRPHQCRPDHFPYASSKQLVISTATCSRPNLAAAHFTGHSTYAVSLSISSYSALPLKRSKEWCTLP